MSVTDGRQKYLYYLIMAAIAVAPLVLVGLYAVARFDDLFGRRIYKYALAHMSEDDKGELYRRLVEQSPGIYEAIPEPLVGRILLRNTKKTFGKACYVCETCKGRVSDLQSKELEGHRPDNTKRNIKIVIIVGAIALFATFVIICTVSSIDSCSKAPVSDMDKKAQDKEFDR